VSTSISIFRNFYTTQSGKRVRGPGAGLGLAINRGIGASRAASLATALKGLPNAAGQHSGRAEVRNSRKADYLLIVNGYGRFASLLRSELEAAGIETLRASDRESAKQMLMRRSPRTVVLDIRHAGLPKRSVALVSEALN